MADENDSYMTRDQIRAFCDETMKRHLVNIVEKHRESAEHPNWQAFDASFKNVHDWRSYVTADVRSVWNLIPLEGRCALIDCCQEAADREHWD